MTTPRYEWTTSYVEPAEPEFTDDLNKLSGDGWEIYAILPFASYGVEMGDFVSIVACREIPAPGPLPAEETVEGPQHTHNCTRCTFLGRFDARGEHFDLYHCMQMSDLPTVIARWSSEGADYTSGIDFGRRALMEGRTDWPLAEAYRRAKDHGLDVRTLDEWAKDREATAEHAPGAEVKETVEVPRCTLCGKTEKTTGIWECRECGENVCIDCCVGLENFVTYHPACDAEVQRRIEALR